MGGDDVVGTLAGNERKAEETGDGDGSTTADTEAATTVATGAT